MRYLAQAKADGRISAEEKVEIIEVQDRKWLMMHNIFKQEPFSVNVATVCWGGGEGRFKSAGWRPPKVTTDATEDFVNPVTGE